MAYDMKKYRVLAKRRLEAVKDQPKQVTAAGIVGSYRGTAGIEAQCIHQQLPITFDVKAESRGIFTAVLGIQAANVSILIY